MPGSCIIIITGVCPVIDRVCRTHRFVGMAKCWLLPWREQVGRIWQLRSGCRLPRPSALATLLEEAPLVQAPGGQDQLRGVGVGGDAASAASVDVWGWREGSRWATRTCGGWGAQRAGGRRS